MFTANPASGRREETVISAAWGLGEAVVSGQVDTDDLVVDTAAGRVLSRATADKQVMVMQPDSGGTVTVPVPEDRRRAPVLSDTRALDLAAWGSRITEHFGAPQDVEWALAGTELMITQARPIIALPPPSGPVPATWPVPREHSAYFRGSIIEQMPDPLSPLFADLARAYVTVGMGQTLEDASGSTAFAADGFDLTTVNGYAYLGVRNSAMVLLTAKAGLMVPRIVRQGIGGPQYWATVGRPRYRELVAEQKARLDIDGTADAATLLDVVRECVLGGFAYYTVVQTVIPPVVIAETLLATFCKRVHRDGDPSAETLLFGYESAPIRAEQSLFDLAAWVREVDDGALARALVAADAPPDSCPEDVDGADFDAFTDAFRAHLSEHGHQTFTLDLMAPVAEDTPTLLWDVLRMYLRGEGTDPRVRRERAAVARETGSARIRAHLRGPLPGTFDRLLRRAQRLNPIREDALADVGLGWPTARRALLELGARLVARGVLDEAPDVFWLHLDEADDLVRELDAAPDATLPSRRAGIERRRAAWRGQLRALPPQILPEKSAWQSLNRWMPSKVAASDAALEGIGASGGTVTGTVRVLTDPARFHEFQVGEILVAAITTPAWTPLFAMAAGVVTDVGGPLSHSSIVAREYGIPAVLGTGRATRILHTGQTVTIDGTAGTVTIVEE
jgi:pyruvate,water dikinase